MTWYPSLSIPTPLTGDINMDGLISKGALPQRLRDEKLEILFRPAKLLEDSLIEQLVSKSLQPHILEFEGPEDVGTPQSPGRFRSLEDFKNWSVNKDRCMYLLLDVNRPVAEAGSPQIAGVSWFGNREHTHAPGRSVTFAMRTYAANIQNGWY